jgi:hypothetical protein
MDDCETRKLILRLQMEDLAAIWPSHTTSTDDAANLDANLSLRLYRQELRAAEQQIDDRRSARAVAQDGLRQRDAVRADCEAARRPSSKHNSDGPASRLVGDGHLAPTYHSTFRNDLCEAAAQASSQPVHFSGQPSEPWPSSPFSHGNPLSSTSSKRSADHLDSTDKLPSQRQRLTKALPAAGLSGSFSDFLSQRTHPESTHGTPALPHESVQSLTLPPLASLNRKRPAKHEDGVTPSMKKQETLPVNSSTVPGSVSARSRLDNLARPNSGSVFDSSKKSSHKATEASRLNQTTGKKRGSTLKSANARDGRTPSTKAPTKPGPQKLSLSKQHTAPASLPTPKPVQTHKVECIACGEAVLHSKSHSNSCSHAYCSDCISTLFMKAVHDDSLWPPQCCESDMPIAKIEHLLPIDLIPSVLARQAEMSVPIVDRTYCVSCSAFVPHDSVQQGTAVCHKCRTSTCTTCKRKAHFGSCQNGVDQGLKKLEALAKKEGWQKCSNCLMIVQNHIGCNHMT